ncbi:MAG TPA: YbaK/EbsC family protein [Anaerolineae bacterium]|nr:YbaK/EbsC family protein [Anaerolineae bacterium]
MREALVATGIGDVIIELPDSARTAQLAAAALSKHLNRPVAVGAIVKSLVFLADARPVLVLVAGDRRGDPEKLKTALGASDIKIADAETVRAATGFAIGGVPPVGHRADLPTLIDQALGRFETVYAAAGHPHAVFPIPFARLVEATRGQLADVTSA